MPNLAPVRGANPHEAGGATHEHPEPSSSSSREYPELLQGFLQQHPAPRPPWLQEKPRPERPVPPRCRASPSAAPARARRASPGNQPASKQLMLTKKPRLICVPPFPDRSWWNSPPSNEMK